MNITKLTQKFITEHPSIKDCLRRGYINYSALAREICDRLKIDRFDAVQIACRRYAAKIRTQATEERRIRGLVKHAKIRLQNKIMVAIIEKPREFERVLAIQKRIKQGRGDLHIIEGQDTVTLISNSEYANEIREAFRGKVIKLSTDVAQITMVFDERIETTPGVISFIYSLLADNGINIQEEMSCWTDLMMIVDEKDASLAMKVLSLPAA